MAKMLKHFVLGLKKNPPAPPRPDYEGERLKVEEEAARFFDGPDYENLPKSKAKTQVQFAEDKKQDLVVFDNYSEPADFAPKVVGEAEEDPLYMSPLDDRGTAPPLEEEEEDMYCLPYEQQSADERRTSDVVREEATYDVVPDVKSSDEEEEDNNESGSKREDEPKEDEYDEPWEWTVGARLTSSLQVSPAQSLDGSDPEEDEDKMAARRQQRRLLYETAFDSRVKDHLDDRLFSKGDESVARAASRSSFGSTSGSSASSTPTHQPMEIARHSPRRNLVRDGRSLSPRDSSIRNQIVNQNFERRISFSSSQWDSVSRSSGSSDPSSSRESMNLETHSHRSHQNAKKVLSAQDPELKENNASPPPSAGRKSRPSSLLSEVKPDNVPQSPENDVRCSEDYDPPWDVKKKRPTGSVSVPERLSSQQTPPMPTSVTHEQLEEPKPQRTTGPPFRANLNLNLQADSPRKARQNLTLNFGCSALATVGEKVDPQLTLEKQGWYHGSISRVEAEAKLRVLKEGSYLVRNSESSKHDYSLSLKSARGFMHMKIVVTSEGRFILGQFSNPFSSIPEMIQHYSLNKLPIKGAEHMSLLYPVIDQLL